MRETAQKTRGSVRQGLVHWSTIFLPAVGSDRVSGQRTASGARDEVDEVLLKKGRDGCGEMEGESDWKFCTCCSLLSLKNNRAGSAGGYLQKQ